MKIAKKVAVSTKNFVVNHKFAIVATTLVVIQTHAISKHNQFLKEHDLFEEFYHIKDFYRE